MRDLSNSEKHENQKLQKQNEAMTSEIKQLKKDKERLSTEVSSLNEQMIELQVWHCHIDRTRDCRPVTELMILIVPFRDWY
jgi:predicted  nucleic acid-binding Zn-ribbon protein